MQKQPILVFDLDGTLAETAPDLLDSLNYGLGKQGISPVAAADLGRYIGHGGQAMIEQALAQQNRSLHPALEAIMLADFMDYYAAHIPGKSHYFSGALEALQIFREQGYIFAICSNKAEILAKRLIKAMNQQLGIANPFAVIRGGDSFEWKKPDPRHIFRVIAEAGGDPARAVMIGDSAPDIQAAQAAKIPSIACRFGYSDIPVEQLGADKIIDSYAELTPDLVESLLTNK